MAVFQFFSFLYAHFSDTVRGRVSWVIEQINTPWTGSYKFLGSSSVPNTLLLIVIDSSNGNHLGECTSASSGSTWKKFSWILSDSSLICNVSGSVVSKVQFPSSGYERTFSVRILADRGPRCFRDLAVQNERLDGCPPTLRRNVFQQMAFVCKCPSVLGIMDRNSLDSAITDPTFYSFGTDLSIRLCRLSFSILYCSGSVCDDYGPNALCIVDEENYFLSPEIINNASYKCFCPNENNGTFLLVSRNGQIIYKQSFGLISVFLELLECSLFTTLTTATLQISSNHIIQLSTTVKQPEFSFIGNISAAPGNDSFNSFSSTSTKHKFMGHYRNNFSVLIVVVAVASIFGVRYVKRSRKLHGKYNPAKEENAFASGYSIPMTSVVKEERLI
ncbi:unnamed protein product [Dracunculus medinensis]|uniref:Uncharacterized protein n=1 Tax=Dracunculus medinensis TaxID=318479 RepID=A0A3P7QBC5_DRAME|nr:unnamed protein product [Dracunculus medinensis]